MLCLTRSSEIAGQTPRIIVAYGSRFRPGTLRRQKVSLVSALYPNERIHSGTRSIDVTSTQAL